MRRGEIALEGEAGDLLTRLDDIQRLYFTNAEAPAASPDVGSPTLSAAVVTDDCRSRDDTTPG